MNIKEAEKATGLKKANIRYYEQEGLLEPKRNEQNNYRQYDQENVNTLIQIKVLRRLGATVQDIHRLQRTEITLQELMEIREKELRTQIEQKEKMIEACQKVGKHIQKLQDLDDSVLDGKDAYWKRRDSNALRLDKIQNQEQLLERLKMGMLYFLLFYWLVRAAGWLAGGQPSAAFTLGFLLVQFGMLAVWACVRLKMTKGKTEQ